MFTSLERVKQRDSRKRSSGNQEAFLDSVLNALGDAVVVLDRDFRILKANKRYAEQTHFSMEEITGRHCYEVSHHFLKPCYEMGENCAVKKSF